MDRLTRIAGSFAIVMVAYWMYALLVVRWIEPAVDLHSGGAIIDEDRGERAMSEDFQLQQLQSLFPPGAWAAWKLTDPKMFESSQARLIFQDYDNSQPEQGVRIWPCLIVYRYEGPAENDEQRLRQSIILEAPEAVLKFDQPLSFTDFKIRRLEHGQLKGKVRIRSDSKEPGPEDDLLIETQDVELTEKAIFTSHPVDFRWGPHYGRGRDMIIQLLAGAPKPGSEAGGTNITDIKSFELRHIEQLHLDLGPAMQRAPKGDSPIFADTRMGTAPERQASIPVDIDCQGPFHFDNLNRVASFSDRVDVRKHNPTGPADQINCDLLSLYFSERSKDKPGETAAKTANPGSLDLKPERIEARGNPVLVTAPSQKENGGTVVAQGQRLEYNLLANSIALDGGREVFLQQGPNEIRAPALYYKSAGPGRLGQMAALGPGFIRGQSPDQPGEQLEARWAKELRLYPADQRQVIAIKGSAELKYQGVGQLQAGEIYFWIIESPPQPGSSQPGLKADRMLARNNVHMNTEQVACKQVEELTVWFKDVAGGQGASIAGTNAASGRQVAGGSSLFQSGSAPQSALPAGRFEISGRFLEAEVWLHAGKGDSPIFADHGFATKLRSVPGPAKIGTVPQKPEPVLSKLTIRENVCLKEAQTPQPGEAPLVILGDLLVAADLSDRGGTVTVTGQRAHLEGRGLGLTGTNIHLDRGANRVWMDGPGQMDLPMPKDLQTSGVTGPLRVNWRQRMIFDGRTATFTDSVVASTQYQQLTTQTMQVLLQRPVNLGQTSLKEPPQVETVICRGGVAIESRSFNPQQQLVRHDRAQVTDLAVNVLSGALAGGSGWINSVYVGSDNPPAGATAAPGPFAIAGAAGGDSIKCLHVTFQKSVTGNVLSRSVTFADQVRMTYGPANDFDAVLETDNPEQLGERGMVARCDQLTVSQTLLSLGGRESIELEALGNTRVEGKEFTATGHRITYHQAKSMLILAGTGRSDAVLYRQTRPGDDREQFPAQELHYWLNTGKVIVVNPKLLQLSQPPSPSRTK